MKTFIKSFDNFSCQTENRGHKDEFHLLVFENRKTGYMKSPIIQISDSDSIMDDVQVYPQSWTAVYMPLDNVGTWNVRSQNWARQYLGQQFYLRVYSPANSWRDEYPIPKNALLCGRALGRRTRPL